MKNQRNSFWSWKEMKVSTENEYIEITYGDISRNEKTFPVARIGKPAGTIFPVEWIISGNTEDNEEIVEECRKDINYFLVELNEKDAWAYACYHCSTTSNIYSKVHWIHHKY